MSSANWITRPKISNEGMIIQNKSLKKKSNMISNYIVKCLPDKISGTLSEIDF